MSSTYRIRRSAKQWQNLIDEQAGSGLSQVAFCRQERLALSTFTNWKRRLAGKSPAAACDEPESATSPWIDLGAMTGSEPGWDIELDLGGGLCLRLRQR